MERLVANFVRRTHWGSISFVLLAVSVLSGVLVGLQYHASEPLYSVVSIDLLTPYGSFLRALHFYSSQFFFLAMVLHVVAVVWEQDTSVSYGEWLRLVFLVPLGILLLFSGYILRGDSTGMSAGIIAENIAKSIPVAGDLVNSLFFDVIDSGMKRVYTQHFTGLGILFGWAGWNHLRRYPLQWKRWYVVTVGLLAVVFFVDAPLDISRIGEQHLSGPWFFVGVQELLRFFPVLLAGVVFPALGIVSLFFCMPLPDTSVKKTWVPLAVLWTWLLGYAVLTLCGFLRDWIAP